MFKAAIIIDGVTVTKWQKDALDSAGDLLDIRLVLSCTNTKTTRKFAKYFLYYALNFFTLKNYLTRHVKLGYDRIKFSEFRSVNDGNWQKIPTSIINELAESQIDVVIKFGMSLLRIDESLTDYKILSFHHGDPAQYKGRPAGFYELLQMNSSIGTIVQELSNKLDSGRVWAIGYSKVYHHSYKKTAINFYSNSIFLLRKALINLSKESPIRISSDGNKYRLPGNLLVMWFLVIIFFRKIKRLLYGAFYEKKWNIATNKDFNVFNEVSLSLENSKQAFVRPGYNFYADPFFSADGKKIRTEALNSINGLGEIIEIDTEHLHQKNVLLRGGYHFSYPFSFVFNDEEYLLPEVASYSSPYILKTPFCIKNKINLKGLEKYRVVDATVIEFENTLYLFCSMNSNSDDCLYLFHSKGVEKKFLSHPLNPIVIDPSRARMGGRILYSNGKYYRFGQNNSYAYGNGISICEIAKLSVDEYEEEVVGALRLEGVCGPHTIDLFQNKAVFDFYYDKLSLFAWYRRIAPIFLEALRRLRIEYIRTIK